VVVVVVVAADEVIGGCVAVEVVVDRRFPASIVFRVSADVSMDKAFLFLSFLGLLSLAAAVGFVISK